MKLSHIIIIIIIFLFILGCVRVESPITDESPEEITQEEVNETPEVKKDIETNETIEEEKEIETNETNEEIEVEEKESENPFKPGMSWQWQLSGDINTNYDTDIYDIDLFDTPQSVIDILHSKGILIACYFSAGTYEDWRDDAGDFPEESLGNELEEWAGERWLDVANYEEFSDIMKKRLDLAVEKKCDGVEPDNIDGYSNDNGLGLTYDDQLKYNIWLAKQAHERNLSIGYKNNIEQIGDLIEYYDFSVNEQCFQYDECDKLLAFIEQGKGVFGVEYELEPEEFCDEANEMNLSWMKMDWDLDGGRISCK